MTIRKEEQYGTSHEFSVLCETCYEGEDGIPFWNRAGGFGVEQEAWDTARRHDDLFQRKHSVVIVEFTPKSFLE